MEDSASPDHLNNAQPGSENSVTKSPKKIQIPGSEDKSESLSGAQNWDERLAVLNGNYPEVLESFRRLRAKIVHPVDGEPAKSILITSAAPAEGKSFVCANLAGILAQDVDRHALIVDCDLRRPVMASLFGLSNENGLVQYLRDGVGLPDLIIPTGLKRLSLLPAGPPPLNPAELLTSEKMAGMIIEVVNRYHDRLILLDTPPGLAVSETAVLAQHVDGVVVVVRWGLAGREQVRQLVESIGREKILSVVFNGYEMTILDQKMSQKGYGKYYTKQY